MGEITREPLTGELPAAAWGLLRGDVPAPPGVDVAAATGHAAALLDSLGIPCDADGTAETPRRMVMTLAELTAGLRTVPARHLSRTFPPVTDDPGLIVVPRIAFTSVCEHHMLPFTGHATVGYLPSPGARIVGLSKLARLVTEHAARPQLQERLGTAVVDDITQCLDVRGAACVITSAHTCMTLRGAKAAGAAMVTSHMIGVFRDDPAIRAEFLTLAGGAAGVP